MVATRSNGRYGGRSTTGGARRSVLPRFLESRDQAGVVGGPPRFEAGHPAAVAEHPEVSGREVGGALLSYPPDLQSLLPRREAQTAVDHLGRGGAAAGPGEDEVARRKQALALQELAGFGPARRGVALLRPTRPAEQ